MDLHAAQLQIEKLEQQKMELSSTAQSLKYKAERSSQGLKEALMVLQKWQVILPIGTGE
jgi:hypothetical protein